MTQAAMALQGSCHCGDLRVSFTTSRAPSSLQPRACDCPFCTKHGAGWLSDPAGALRIDARKPPREYRQGSGSARFLSCGACGVLVAVVHDGESRRGAVNARCLDDAAAFGSMLSVSPQRLSPDDKRARWRELWTPATLHLAAHGGTNA